MSTGMGLVMLSAACASGQEARPTSDTPADGRTRTLVRQGILRVVGDVEEGGPCTTLAPSLSREMEGGLVDCRYVTLEFSPTGRRGKERVIDFWLVSGATAETGPEDHPVVDFYERVTLGEVGATASGRFRFRRYQVGGQVLMVLEGQGQPR